MALKDMIAQAGPQLFETMRKGWLPTVGERQARSLKDLQIQEAKQTLEYAPAKRKLARRKAESDINYQESLMAKHERDAARLKTEDDKKLYVDNQKTMGQHFQAASKLKTVAQKKAYLRNYKKSFLDAGDDEEDAAFNAVLNMSGDQFKESFNLAVQGNKYIQGLNEKRFGKSTTLQNLESGDIKTVMFDDPNYQMKVDTDLNQGYTISKTPGIEMQGDPNQFGIKDKKLNRELINEQTGIETANFIGGRTIDLITKSPESLGAAGGFARMSASLSAQIDSSFKLAGKSWKAGTSFEPDSYRAIFQNAGIDNVVVRGNLTQLARMLATSSGEGKVLSDKDMKRWLNVVAVGNGDPKIVSAAIRNALEIQNFRYKQKYYNSTRKRFTGDLGMPRNPDDVQAESIARNKQIEKRLAEIRNQRAGQ